MPETTPELSTLIEEAIASRLIDVHTSIPGRIQSYDSVTKIAEVEVMTNRFLEKEDGTLVSETLGVLKNVRVYIPKANNYFQSFPVSPGVTGLIHFTERSFGQWAATEEVSDPDDSGVLTMSGAVFYPGGLITNAEAESINDDISEGIALGKIGGVQLRLKEDAAEVTSGGSATADVPVAKSDVVDSFNAAVDQVLSAIDGALLGGAWTTAKLAAFPDTIPPGTVPSSASENLKVD